MAKFNKQLNKLQIAILFAKINRIFLSKFFLISINITKYFRFLLVKMAGDNKIL